MTSTGKATSHSALLKILLKAVLLPSKLALCKCAAHTKGTDPVSIGNEHSDETAKNAATGTYGTYLTSENNELIDEDILKQCQDDAPQQEKTKWTTEGATKQKYIYVKENKPILPKNLYETAAILSHGSCHVSTGGMVEITHKYFYTFGFNSYAKSLVKHV